MPYLFDEHISPLYRDQLQRRLPTRRRWFVGGDGAPPLSAPDSELLRWCEAHDAMLVTNDQGTMPTHLARHLAEGHHIPGIFICRPERPIGEMIDHLELIAGAMHADEFADSITYLPFR